MPLNETQRQGLIKHIDSWMRIGLSTAPTDKAAAERGVQLAYGIVGLPAPSRILWFESPLEGAIAAANAATVFDSAHARVWRQPQDFMTTKLWKKAEAANLVALFQDIERFFGTSPLQGLRNNILTPIGQQIAKPPSGQKSASMSTFVKSKVRDPNVVGSEAWNNALTTLRLGLTPVEVKKLSGNVSWDNVGEQLRHCGFGSMDAAYLGFMEYGNVSGFQLNDLSGIAAVARAAGWWWPFKDICVISMRPSKLCLERGLRLHKHPDMAVQYPDKWGLFFLHGKPVSQEAAEQYREGSIDEIKAEQAVYAPTKSFDI